MKAKEWAVKFQEHGMQFAMSRYVAETKDLITARKAISDHAVEGVFREQCNKLLAVQRLLGETWRDLDLDFYHTFKGAYPQLMAAVDRVQTTVFLRKQDRVIEYQRDKELKEVAALELEPLAKALVKCAIRMEAMSQKDDVRSMCKAEGLEIIVPNESELRLKLKS